MPPSADERIRALHMLSVLRAAQALVARVTSAGGAIRVSIDDVRAELAAVCDAASRLAVYEARAATRGAPLSPLLDTRIAEAIDDLRRRPLVNTDQEELLEMPERDVDEAFALGTTNHDDDEPFTL